MVLIGKPAGPLPYGLLHWNPRVTYVSKHKYILWVQNKFEEQKTFFMLTQLRRMVFPPNFGTNFNFGPKTRTWCFGFKKKNKKVT